MCNPNLLGKDIPKKRKKNVWKWQKDAEEGSIWEIFCFCCFVDTATEIAAWFISINPETRPRLGLAVLHVSDFFFGCRVSVQNTDSGVFLIEVITWGVQTCRFTCHCMECPCNSHHTMTHLWDDQMKKKKKHSSFYLFIYFIITRLCIKWSPFHVKIIHSMNIKVFFVTVFQNKKVEKYVWQL